MTCPDCTTDGPIPTGEVGLRRDGSPIVCPTCGGRGTIAATEAQPCVWCLKETEGWDEDLRVPICPEPQTCRAQYRWAE